MEAVRIQGTCTRCGAFTRSVGADEKDAQLIFNQDHGVDHGHPFEGETTTHDVDYAEFVRDGLPKRTKR